LTRLRAVLVRAGQQRPQWTADTHPEITPMMHHFDHILDALSQKTQRVFATALGAERHRLLTRRLDQLYGTLELARLLGSGPLARRIETLIDTVRHSIETDG
jgi:hypothetical protein